MTKKPIIPILQHGLTTIDNPQDILMYVLRHFITVPGLFTDTWWDDECSLSYIYAESGGEKEQIQNRIIKALSGVLGRIFGEGSSVEVIAYMGDQNTEDRYTLTLEMGVIVDGQSYSTKNVMILNKTSNTKLTIDLDGNVGYTNIGV